jgi:arylsulfatase A-like enzyme
MSGVMLWIFVRNNKSRHEKKTVYWGIFVLIPFTLTYGLLGRFSVNAEVWFPNFGKPVFDHHLSLVWAVCVCFFVLQYVDKSRPLYTKMQASFFVFEIFIIALLFWFCSNLELLKLTFIFRGSTNFFQNLGITERRFLVLVYMVGLITISGFYYVVGFIIRPVWLREKKWLSGPGTLIGLFVIVSFSVSGSFIINQRINRPQSFFTKTSSAQTPAKDSPNVILIVLDTVRSDCLSIYSKSGVAKNLEAFSKEAFVYNRCIANSSWTAPTHASLFTGLYSKDHGVYGDIDSNNNHDVFGFPNPLPLLEDKVTLAQTFHKAGYHTAAISANLLVLRSNLGLRKGFQYISNSKSIGAVYTAVPFGPIFHIFCFISNFGNKYVKYYRTADDIMKESLKVIERFKGAPFFLFVNYFDSHGPYLAPRKYSGYYLNKLFPQLYRLKIFFLQYLGRLEDAQRDFYQKSQYDGEIDFVDTQLGNFFDKLKSQGLYDNSLIVVTSDHGEAFGEHGLYWHRDLMYNGVAYVPLIIKFPFNHTVGREDKLVSLCDVYPTILSIAGLTDRNIGYAKEKGISAERVFSEFNAFETGVQRVMYEGKYKYMHFEKNRPPELYDIEADSKESKNLVDQLPEVVRKTDKALKKWAAIQRFRDPNSSNREKMSDERLETLKALGYIQ